MSNPVLHLNATVLPTDEPVDLWVADGTVSTEPLPGAETISRGGYVLPGLVDAHCHIGLDADGGVDVAASERQALIERRAGVLLIRDAGVPVDTHWIDDRTDLPRIIRCGRHIARTRRYIRNYAVEVEPEELVAEVERQVAASDGWVKVVGDWIDREVGDLAPLWPREVVAAAVDRAHQLGARITTHVFGEEAVADWVAAGADCIEHGTGLTDEVIDEMARRGTALDPTLIQIENFGDFAAAGEAKFPTYAKHMRDLYERRFETVGKAVEAGVPVYAGSDAGGLRPHGTIADEVALLAQVGGTELALGAASWRAREWLGAAVLDHGDPADLIMLDEDPRKDLRALSRPAAVMLAGRVVA